MVNKIFLINKYIYFNLYNFNLFYFIKILKNLIKINNLNKKYYILYNKNCILLYIILFNLLFSYIKLNINKYKFNLIFIFLLINKIFNKIFNKNYYNFKLYLY